MHSIKTWLQNIFCSLRSQYNIAFLPPNGGGAADCIECRIIRLSVYVFACSGQSNSTGFRSHHTGNFNQTVSIKTRSNENI